MVFLDLCFYWWRLEWEAWRLSAARFRNLCAFDRPKTNTKLTQTQICFRGSGTLSPQPCPNTLNKTWDFTCRFSKSCLSFFWLFSVKHRKQHYDCGEALYPVNPFFEILKKGILSRTVCFSSPAVNLLILGLA